MQPTEPAGQRAPEDVAVPLPAHEVAELRALHARLDLGGMVDLHTHFMPPQVLAKVWAYFDRVGGRVEHGWPIAYRWPEPQRLARLRAFGVLAFTSMVYPHKPDMAVWLNDWAAGFAAATPGCLPTATFYPEPGAGRYVAEAIDAGAAVFKAHVQVGGYDPNDPLLDPVWDVLAQRRVPVVIHAGSGPEPGAHTGPEPIARLLRRHPRLVLVVAHMGLPEYGPFLDLARKHPDTYLDTTMAFTDFSERLAPFPRSLLPRLLDVGERIVFGSDFPNIPYPYLHAVQSLERLDLGDAWLRGVLHDNAQRLLAAGRGAGVN